MPIAARSSDTWLKIAFTAMLALRFFYPFYDNPLTHIFSDPARHWENGERLFDPTLMGSIDPKLYQVWVWLVRAITHDNRTGVAFFSGLLCMAFPFLWYRCCREIMPKKHARIFTLILGLCPMLLLIFVFFMTETLMLDMLALAFWLTFRAIRKGEFKAYAAAGLVWMLCTFTRSTAIPFVLLGAGYLLRHTARPWLLTSLMAGMLAVCAIPAGLHSYKMLHIFAPFQFGGLGRLTHLSPTQTFEIHTDKGWYTYSSPAFYHPPFYPIPFESVRPKGDSIYTIDTKKGAADWDANIARAEHAQNGAEIARNMMENMVFFMFGPTWPDSSLSDPYLLMRINYHLHWVWPVVIILLFFRAPSTRLPAPQAFIMLLTIVITALMLVQPFGLMEGRYRKPLEPLLLLCMYFIAVRPAAKPVGAQVMSLYGIAMDSYVRPLINLVKRV